MIAEAACEHKGRFEYAKRLARAAKSSGAAIIKFQLHLPDVEMIPRSIKFWAGSMDSVLEKVNLSVDDHRRLMLYCKSIGIQYLCTAYCAAGIDVLEELGVPAFKTGSGEMTNLPMMRHVARISAKTRKPVLVSTGMSRLEEIKETVAVFKEEGARFMLFNCTSEYPPKPAHINLGVMRVLREQFGVHVGHSDHTPTSYTALAAAALGARAIEKHVTLARRYRGPDWHVSLEPQELRDLVLGIRIIEAALGSTKRLHAEEKSVRAWAHHSVVTRRRIGRGDRFSLENLIPKRPGYGIPSKYLDERYGRKILGRRARRDLPANVLLKWQDIL